MLKHWKQLVFLGSLVTVLGALWLWGSSPTAVHACDDRMTIFNECELEFEFTIRAIEKINVYRYVETDEGLFLCYRNVWVYINDRQTLIDNRATNAPVYPNYGSVGLFKQETFEELLNNGVIDLAPIVAVLYETEEQCVLWEGGHIQDDGPPTLPEEDIEPLDPFDPPLWKEIVLEEPIEGISQLFVYGYETETGFYKLAFVHNMD